MPLRRGVALGLFATVTAFAATPDIESISPRALRPGIAIEWKFSGSALSEATNVWANFSGEFEPLGEGRFRITTSSNESVGVRTIRLFGSNGVSALHFVMIDDLPTVIESKTNKTRAAAQRVEFGMAVEGRCEESSYDWFQVHAKKNQQLAIEVVATRLGSRLDSVLRVFDGAGRQLAQNDDAPGLRGDSFIHFKAPADGSYFIELRDVIYSGGAETFYRLRIGDFRLATTVYPPVVTRGGNLTSRLAGPSGEVGQVEMHATNPGSAAVAVKGPAGSTFAKTLVTATAREILEREPNDSAAKATKIALSGGVSGRFDKAGDRDWFEFTAAKGARHEFRAASRSLGAPCDVVLEIHSADSKTVARSNPTAADEGVVAHRFAADGTYRLVVEEATGAFGANCVYHVAMQPAAGFALSLETDRFNVAPGKSFDLKVSVTRGDYKGAVTLAIEGLESLQWTNNVIAEGKSNATMKVSVPQSLLPGRVWFFSVIGTAQRDGGEARAKASTAPALRRRFPQMLYVPPECDGEAALGIVAE